jgi:hypothetical protein
MKNLFIGICCALTFGAQAQAQNSTITRSYPIKAGDELNFKFDYPSVKISTWDKNEVSVIATFNLDDAEKNNYFALNQKTVNGTVNIDGHINFEKLPMVYSVTRNGVKTIFKTKEEFKVASKEKGVQFSSEGPNIHITVEIKVPAGCSTKINDTYGLVEIVNFNAPITVDGTYGGVDATINTAQTGKVKATTQYGEILTNLDAKITDHEKRDFFSSITFDPGNGKHPVILTSGYGKIYLRKP